MDIPKKPVLWTIRVYQRVLSPDSGIFRFLFPFGCCRFRPTCSEYAYQAIVRHGILRGCYLGFRRLLRCNPWNRGGNDPV
ncbi:membrane protein insertion efficiency factor YidD [Candidatus Uhrbacteria bacterium]|nr:membrane protein insertion efficiency factor YidD [Candidatus Uhrbacteria bacterium]